MSDDLRTPLESRARAVGNAVYVEHIGGSGDIASWGMPTREAAVFVAGEINALLNGLRTELADVARKAGEYAHATIAEIQRLQEAVKWWQGVAENKQDERDAESDRAASWKNLAEKYQELAEARKDALGLSARHKDEADRLRAALELLSQIRHVSWSAQAAFRSNLKVIDAVLERGLDVRKDGALEELLG